jgi:hypothetical protein
MLDLTRAALSAPDSRAVEALHNLTIPPVVRIMQTSSSGKSSIPIRHTPLAADEIISSAELSKRLSLTERAIFELREKRQIPVIRLNSRNFRYNWKHVLAALEKLEVKAVQ